jgi:hypothetical protein
MLGSLAMAQGPGSLSQGGFFSSWWGASVVLDPYEILLPTAYWYPSADQNNTDRILGIASTNTVNAASVTTNGWEFNGTSQYLDMGRPPEIELGTNLQYSMAAWFRQTAVGSVRGIMGKSQGANGDRWSLYIDTRPATILQEGTAGLVALVSPTSYSSNTWYHLAMTINRSAASNFFLYIDGAVSVVGTFTNTGAITYDGNVNVPFRFGSFNSTAGAPAFYFNGVIDQAAVWNGRALTSNEVFNLFQDTRSGRK